MDPSPTPAGTAAPLSATAPPPLHHHHMHNPTLSYPDSVDSSPRSRTTDSGWDEPVPSAGGGRLRLMCSYGGHIVPRPHDKSLCYVGGETRIVVADRSSSLADLSSKLSKTLLGGKAFTLKYQLPSEDLDSLISVTTDEDLDNMIDEYDRTAAHGGASSRPSRLRLFLFAAKPESSQSIGPILDNPAKSEDWFLNALNGAAGGLLNRGFSDSASVNCLLGLDDDVVAGGGGRNGANSNSNLSNLDPGTREMVEPSSQKNSVKLGNFQDVHSVPDSPMLDTTSSFGSTSSSPSLANLPPIRVRVEDGGGAIRGVQDQKIGLMEEQFSQMSLAAGINKQDEGSGFVVLSSPQGMPPPTAMVASSSSSSLTVPASSSPVGIDYAAASRVISDDERSDHGGMPIGYRKQQQTPQALPQKPTGVFDLPSPDSVSSDSSFGNAIPRLKPVAYHQDPMTRVSQLVVVDPKLNNISDPASTRVFQDSSGYVMQQQFDPKQQAQTQRQFVHPGSHYIHQHHPPGTVPISAAYYPVYTSQKQQHPHHHHQIDQQFPVYYIPARQAQQPYSNMSAPQQQQPNMGEASSGIIPTGQPQTHLSTNPNPNSGMVHHLTSTTAGYNPMRTAQMSRPEIATTMGMYRVQVPTAQQYGGYSQIHHHPPQSLAPGAAASYSYEYADPAHAQIYFTQPMPPPTMASQYQTMTGTTAATVGIMPDVSGQLPADSIKQQIRTSQPL